MNDAFQPFTASNPENESINLWSISRHRPTHLESGTVKFKYKFNKGYVLCFSEKPLLFSSLPLPKSQNVTKICQGQSKCMKNCLSETTFIVKIMARPQNRNYSQLHCQSLVIIRKLPAKKELVVYRRSKISVVLAFRKTVERK